MRIAAVLFYCLAVLPIRLRLRLRIASGSLPQGALRIDSRGLSFSLPLSMLRVNGRFYLQLGKKRTIPIYLRFKHRKKTLIRIFPPLGRLRSDWLRHTRFCLLASVGLPDAAQTALLCASLQAALCRVSRLDARVQPQYRAPGYDVHFECIAAFRLGKLWLTAAALAFAAARRSIHGGTAGGNHPGSANQHGHADRA